MAKANKRTNSKVKLYASPKMRQILVENWLLEPYGFGGKTLLLRILEALGFSGSVTAYFKNCNPLNNREITFVGDNHNDTDDNIILRLYKNSSETNNEVLCTIPGYNEQYSKYFSIIYEDKIRFFDFNPQMISIIPRFEKLYYGSDCRCMQLSEKKEPIMVTFTVEKFHHMLSFSILIDNDAEHIKLLDAYTYRIFETLRNVPINSSAYEYYDKTRTFLCNFCQNYVVSLYNINDTCLNKIVVENNEVISFMLPDFRNDRIITVYKNQDWHCKTPIMEASKKIAENGTNYSINATVRSEFHLEKVQSLSHIKSEIESFIKDNMWFAFENN